MQKHRPRSGLASLARGSRKAAGKARREEREAAHAIDCAARAAVAASSKAEFEASIAEAQAAIAYIVALFKSTRASSDEEGAAPATVRSPGRAVMSDSRAAVAASMSPAPTAACNETSAVEAVQAASSYAGSAAHREDSAAVVASTEAGARRLSAAENRAALEAWLYATQEARREEAAALATARSATARAMSDPGASSSAVLKAALETSADEATQADLFEAKLAAGRDAALAAHREEKKAAVLASVGAVGEARHAPVDAASMPDVQAAAAS
eukprot:gene20829-27659_t